MVLLAFQPVHVVSVLDPVPTIRQASAQVQAERIMAMERVAVQFHAHVVPLLHLRLMHHLQRS
jgi:hypothetical protein